jgi:hypothetical protein
MQMSASFSSCPSHVVANHGESAVKAVMPLFAWDAKDADISGLTED